MNSTSQSLVTDARTIVHLANHFSEMKQAAEAMKSKFAASERGFFTPSEDDEIRHLLVSYWQSRNALLELVLSFRDYASLPVESRNPTFLVAYAGALLLIDMARFLRESFEDRPVVRRKLNESIAAFGIPAGVYDIIQMSLTNPANAWRFHQATEYFEQHESEIRKAASGEPLPAVLGVVDQLRERVRVSLSGYLTSRARARARQVVTAIEHDAFGQAVYTIQEFVSKLVSSVTLDPSHTPHLPAEVANEIRALIKPGDVFITRREHALTNYFLPGYWPHGALYLGDAADLQRLGIHEHENVRPRWQRLVALDPQEPRRVFEALKDGVWIRSLSSPLSVDALAVLRPQLSEAEIAQALARGLFHEGKPYDFDFDFTRSDRIVCTGVVFRSYEGIGDIRFELTRRVGRLTLAAEDLIRMALDRRHFEPVAAFSANHAKTLQKGNEADQLLRITLNPG